MRPTRNLDPNGIPRTTGHDRDISGPDPYALGLQWDVDVNEILLPPASQLF
jgi:hypothetical protein